MLPCYFLSQVLSPIDDKSIEVVLSSLGSNLPPERLRQTTCLQWIRFFLTISTTKNLQLLPLVSQILSAVLPCLDDRDEIDDRSQFKFLFGIYYLLLYDQYPNRIISIYYSIDWLQFNKIRIVNLVI